MSDMKKFCLFAAYFVFAAFGVFAFDELPTCWTNKSGEVYTYYTNLQERIDLAISRGSADFCYWGRVRPSDYGLVDDKMSASTNFIFCTVQEYPKSTVKFYNAMISNGDSVGYMRYELNMKFGDKSYRKDGSKMVNALDFINWKFTNKTQYVRLSTHRLSRFKTFIVNSASKTTKAQLRNEGKTFVVKDNVNPVQERLDALTAALDAPFFDGLEDACAKCGITVNSDFRKGFPTANDIATLKRKVFMGEVEFTDANKVWLMVGLGVTEFNVFVKEYNGDAQ